MACAHIIRDLREARRISSMKKSPNRALSMINYNIFKTRLIVKPIKTLMYPKKSLMYQKKTNKDTSL